MPRTVTQYYASLKHLSKVFARQARQTPVPIEERSIEEMAAWQKQTHAKL